MSDPQGESISRASAEALRRVRIIAPGRPSTVVLQPRGQGRHYVRFQAQRKFFVIKVYILATAFISLSVCQWLFILKNPNIKDEFRKSYSFALLAAICASLLLVLFSVFVEMRYRQPHGTIVALAIVELSTLGVMDVVLDSKFIEMVLSIVFASMLHIVFTIVGIVMKRDLTLDIAIMTLLSFFFYVLASIALIVVIIMDLRFYSLPFVIVVIILLLVYTMYIAQVVFGSRSTALRWRDYVFASLLIYYNFVVLLVMILFTISVCSYKLEEYDF